MPEYQAGTREDANREYAPASMKLMRSVPRLIITLTMLAVLMGSAWIYHEYGFQTALGKVGFPVGRPAAVSQGLEASGTIEATIISVASEASGILERIEVEEGEGVTAGQRLFSLDTALIDADIRRAQAAHGVAIAALEMASAGAPAEAIAQAEALQDQALLAAQAARQAWEDARAILEAPKALDVELAAARTQAALAAGRLEIARMKAEAADLEQSMYGRLAQSLAAGFTVEVPGPEGPTPIHVPAPPYQRQEADVRWNVAGQQSWQAYATLNIARAARDAALQAVEDLQTQLAEPIALEARLTAAEAGYEEALAAVGIAKAAVEDLKAGARAEDIALVGTGVSEAEAVLNALLRQQEKMTVHSPISGRVLERSVRPGEYVSAGMPVIRIADLDRLILTLYIQQKDLGRITLGQKVEVRVDSYPDRVFTGEVLFIAGEAEFTPKNVQTREERSTLVFAVKVEIPNPEHMLKPGMPADAIFLPHRDEGEAH